MLLRLRGLAPGLLVALALLAGAPAARALTWDLADDWSDTANPNGVWSYNGAPGTPIAGHVADWDTGSSAFLGAQPAWAAATLPAPGHVPMWMKSVGTGAAAIDLPSGAVGLHGAENAAAGVTWTSPIDGAVDLTGGTWQFVKSGVHAGRSMTWTILLNATVLTSGVISGADAFNSAAPFDFATGSGGAAAISNLSVQTGDVITLQFTKISVNATFAGVDLTLTEVPEPAALALWATGILALLSTRRHLKPSPRRRPQPHA